ncbi:MAG: YwaF family protein [Clostridia bacterium]|nr:YwaF family protein [Clostridia bacterium]
MTWGSFGVVHITSLVLGIGLIIGLYFLLKKCSQKTQTIILGILSFAGIGAIVYNLLMWDSPLEYLPFHLCSLTAMVLPFAVWMRSKILNNLLLFWGLGALLALVVNTAQANFEIFSWTFVFYFFPHLLEIGIPILMFSLRLVKRDVKCIGSTLLITLVAYTIIHFINVALNDYFLSNQILNYEGNLIQVNYMYSIKPENPVLQLFYNIIPYPYWYMFLSLPLIVVYLGCFYRKYIILWFKERKANRKG